METLEIFEQEGFKNSLAVVHGKKWLRRNRRTRKPARKSLG